MTGLILLTFFLPGSEIDWIGDLEKAAMESKDQEKLILLRQVICECDGSYSTRRISR